MKNASEAKGSIQYGLHFYPGVAQYQEEGKEPYRVFLNEDTLRSMDPTFAGRPVFVLHVNEVETDLNELRKEADGWVIESFYNPSDGKHWVKFVVVSEKGERAIAQGMKLSNCYLPKTFGPGGTWNGIDYDRSITQGEYEHLAIVPNPRYEESVIMNPEEFKKYNEDNFNELKKLSNQKDKEPEMKFNFFKRTKVENSIDLESMSVMLPRSKREISLEKLINDADEPMDEKMAHPEHKVEVGEKKMSVKELKDAYMDCMSKMDSMKDDDDMMDDDEESEDPAAKNKRKNKKKNKEESMKDEEEADTSYVHDEDDDEKGEERKKSLKLDEEDDEKEVEAAKKKNAREKAERLRNANKAPQEFAKVVLSADQVARGKSLYGSK